MIEFIYTGTNGHDLAYQTQMSACFDLRADEAVLLSAGKIKLISTGVRIRGVPEPNLFAEVRPRSGMTKNGLIAHLGTIDPDYQGDIKVILENRTNTDVYINIGDRIAQMMIQSYHLSPSVQILDRVRGEGGFGSTGHQ